jgi:hypothetical protein
MASAIGIAPANSASTNSAAYIAWRDDDSDVDGDISKSTTLVFDNPGTYSFNHQTLRVPENRKLTAVHGVTLKCETSGQAGSCFVSGSGALFSLENLTLDANSKVDFALLVAGTAAVPGPRASVRGVVAKSANQACIRGFNSLLELRGCGTDGGPDRAPARSLRRIGRRRDLRRQPFAVRAARARCFRRSTLPNGGRVTLSRVSCAGTNGCGLALDGVAGAAVHTAVLVGVTQAAIRIANKSSNVRIFGTRLLSGTAVDFDGCNNSYVWGGCVSTMKVVYRGDARSCRAFFVAESAIAPADILQEWGSSAWPGTCGPTAVCWRTVRRRTATGNAGTKSSERRRLCSSRSVGSAHSPAIRTRALARANSHRCRCSEQVCERGSISLSASMKVCIGAISPAEAARTRHPRAMKLRSVRLMRGYGLQTHSPWPMPQQSLRSRQGGDCRQSSPDLAWQD